jgi:hypothetical protein
MLVNEPSAAAAYSEVHFDQALNKAIMPTIDPRDERMSPKLTAAEIDRRWSTSTRSKT